MLSYNHIKIEAWMRRSEMGINNLCNLFAKELSDRTLYMCDEINSWRDALVRQIDDHVRDQRRLLEQEYRKQQNYIEDTRQQFIDATRPLEHSGNNERIDQLIAQCKALKFELAALEFPERTIPFIEFMTEEKLARKKRDEKKTDRTEYNKPRKNSSGGYDNLKTNNAGAHGSVTLNQTSTTFNQGNRPTSGTTHTSAAYTDSNSNTKGDGDLIPKCPTCFMIFPSYMLLKDREQHVEEHFNDS